jgi:hypothetical protein
MSGPLPSAGGVPVLTMATHGRNGTGNQMHYTGPITIIHACGHSEEYVLYDRHGRARHQDHWMQSRTCRACTAAQMDAAATAVTHDLLNLTGSPKQID